MDISEFKKSKVFNIAGILGYISDSVMIKTINKKNLGNVSAVSFDSGAILTGKISPYDTFIQIIEGEAELVIKNKSHLLKAGQSIIVPAHTHNVIKANVRFKMLSTIMKCAYE
jgi:quercetin dioxygenase-like cupin family protein